MFLKFTLGTNLDLEEMNLEDEKKGLWMYEERSLMLKMIYYA